MNPDPRGIVSRLTDLTYKSPYIQFVVDICFFHYLTGG